MTRVDINLAQLRNMIGLRVRHGDLLCEIIEILDDGPTLVLKDIRHAIIQSNKFGDATRRVPETHTVPVLSTDHAGLHPAFRALELVDDPAGD